MSEIHILHKADAVFEWTVWLGGICIGVGETRDLAVADAVKDLEAALERLQQPA